MPSATLGTQIGLAQRGAERIRALAPELVLVLLSLPVIAYGLGSYSLVNGDEAIYQGIAERMVASGNWLRLEFGTEHRVYDTFMNAPLHYWARAAAIALFGSNLWTARILSALFGIAGVVLTCRMARPLGNLRGAFLAGLVQLTTLHFIYLHAARTGELETALCFAIALAAHGFARAVTAGRSFALHHVCLALLLNLKLPLAVVPVTAALAGFALIPEARPQFRRWLRGALWILPLALVWHVYQMTQLWEEALQVAATMAGQASGSAGYAIAAPAASQLQYYASVLLFGAYPYALAYPAALLSALRRWRAREPRWVAFALHALCVLVFYGLVSKRAPWYVMPVYPFLSIFVGHWLADLLAGRVGRAERLGIALVAGTLPWLWLPIADFNPFAAAAVHMPMEFAWRAPGTASLLGVSASVLAVAALLFGLPGLARERAARHGGALLAVVLLALAAARVAAPLRHLGYQSPLAQLDRSLAEARASGIAPRTPILLPAGPVLVMRYYFARDYQIGLAPPSSADPAAIRLRFQLRPKNDTPSGP